MRARNELQGAVKKDEQGNAAVDYDSMLDGWETMSPDLQQAKIAELKTGKLGSVTEFNDHLMRNIALGHLLKNEAELRDKDGFKVQTVPLPNGRSVTLEPNTTMAGDYLDWFNRQLHGFGPLGVIKGSVTPRAFSVYDSMRDSSGRAIPLSTEDIPSNLGMNVGTGAARARSLMGRASQARLLYQALNAPPQ